MDSRRIRCDLLADDCTSPHAAGTSTAPSTLMQPLICCGGRGLIAYGLGIEALGSSSTREMKLWALGPWIQGAQRSTAPIEPDGGPLPASPPARPQAGTSAIRPTVRPSIHTFVPRQRTAFFLSLPGAFTPAWSLGRRRVDSADAQKGGGKADATDWTVRSLWH